MTSWSDGVSDGAVTSYRFTNVDRRPHHRSAANFAIDTYTITSSAGANGSITPAAPAVNSGDNQSFLIVPSPGYHVADVVVDGVSQGAIGSYTYYNVIADGHVISATFAIDTYTITATAGANGSIAPAGATVVNSGDNQAYTISPAAGYHVADVLVDGVSRRRGDVLHFTNVTADHTISATFAINTYTITATAGANGSIAPAGATVVNSGDSQAYTISASPGYHVADVLVDGVSVGAVTSLRLHQRDRRPHHLGLLRHRHLHDHVRAPAPTAPSRRPASTVVNSGDSQSYTISASPGYHVVDVVVDGVSKAR